MNHNRKKTKQNEKQKQKNKIESDQTIPLIHKQTNKKKENTAKVTKQYQ